MTAALFKKQMMEVFSWLYKDRKSGKLRSARGHFNRLLHGFTVHVVQHDNVCAYRKSLLHLVKSSCFNFYLEHMTRFLAQSVYCGGDAAVCVNMVVLEHCRVGKVIAVISAAAHKHRVLLQGTKSGQSLSCIGYGSVGSCNKLYALVCIGCNSAHMLDNVQRCSLTLEHSAGVTLEAGDYIAFLHLIAVLELAVDFNRIVQQIKHSHCHIKT